VCTFAEMSLVEKNRISHRSKALTQLFQFLKSRA
jgi:inosine/xanthosine triphosphate pyrophosphatase family protein